MSLFAPDTNAAKFWLMNRRGNQWREKQLVEVADPIASMTPEQRLASVVDIMARARALLAEPDPADVTDAEYEETEQRCAQRRSQSTGQPNGTGAAGIAEGS